MTERHRLALSYLCSIVLHGALVLSLPCVTQGADGSALMSVQLTVDPSAAPADPSPPSGVAQDLRTPTDRVASAGDMARSAGGPAVRPTAPSDEGLTDAEADRAARAAVDPTLQAALPADPQDVHTLSPDALAELATLPELPMAEPDALLDPDRVQVVQTAEDDGVPDQADFESAHDVAATELTRTEVTDVDLGESVQERSARASRGGEATEAQTQSQRPSTSQEGANGDGVTKVDASRGADAVNGSAGGGQTSWWEPFVRRIWISDEPPPAEDPTEEGQGAQQGMVGNEGHADPTPQAPEDASDAPEEPDQEQAEAPSEPDEVTRPDPTEDPAAEVEEVALLGVVGTEGTSEQLVVDAAEGPAQVNARKTPRGTYVQEVDRIVHAEWKSRELPVQMRGRGVKGSVTVRFSIARNGRVGALEITSTSGNEWLDILAYGAVPPRLPRIPKEVEEDPLVHEITFHYR